MVARLDVDVERFDDWTILKCATSRVSRVFFVVSHEVFFKPREDDKLSHFNVGIE